MESPAADLPFDTLDEVEGSQELLIIRLRKDLARVCEKNGELQLQLRIAENRLSALKCALRQLGLERD